MALAYTRTQKGFFSSQRFRIDVRLTYDAQDLLSPLANSNLSPILRARVRIDDDIMVIEVDRCSLIISRVRKEAYFGLPVIEIDLENL